MDELYSPDHLAIIQEEERAEFLGQHENSVLSRGEIEDLFAKDHAIRWGHLAIGTIEKDPVETGSDSI